MTPVACVLVPGLCEAVSRRPDHRLPPIFRRLLRRGHSATCHVAGWEAELARRLGFGETATGPRNWLAFPVSITAGLTDLVATAVEDLSGDHREALWAAVQPEMERIGARRSFRLRLPDELEFSGDGAWQGVPPSVGLGRPMAPVHLDSVAARTLQAFATFVQMTWFDHPVNRERAQAGLAPVQGLWLWSPGMRVAETEARRVAGGGATARWLAERACVPWCADPLDRAADLTVVEALLHHSGDNDGLDGLLTSIAEDVLAARVDGLRRGGYGGLVLQDPGRFRLDLDVREWRRFWRRGRGLSGLCRTSVD